MLRRSLLLYGIVVAAQGISPETPELGCATRSFMHCTAVSTMTTARHELAMDWLDGSISGVHMYMPKTGSVCEAKAGGG
ncbi:hypothetical protein BZA05DRAFT_399304 [Tricharina praecox]|uniref:uncharacterized protein n=1 Tax=Tricharina praecox TaxID=43433 RepID=UPI00221F09C1|nr:uncharacterized protein BZA05DRAFT_399304 [Tricharina praecox]KAI5850961.1 hypothetical protein BZA05DRAFT_399304 [Tricharina praecox]